MKNGATEIMKSWRTNASLSAQEDPTVVPENMSKNLGN